MSHYCEPCSKKAKKEVRHNYLSECPFYKPQKVTREDLTFAPARRGAQYGRKQ